MCAWEWPWTEQDCKVIAGYFHGARTGCICRHMGVYAYSQNFIGACMAVALACTGVFIFGEGLV